ncbi:hypothetical protein [Aggregatilinea lenta]|uniref:hypothetical protein n=1 Tax=Aggregatilinea lenta TaxID=913108 RepID=UPI000E5A1FD8|nr:hypothetical protein [Aggregatilinea lenta]
MNEKQYVIAYFKKNWADEFDVCGFIVGERDDVTQYVRQVDNAPKGFWPQDWYFGTNERIVFHNAAEFDRCWTIEPVRQETFEDLVHGRPIRFWGLSPCVILDSVGDWLEDA